MRHQDFYGIDHWICPRGTSAIGRIGHKNLILSAPEAVRDGALRFIYGCWQSPKGPDAALHEGRGSFSGIQIDPEKGIFSLVVDRRASEPIFYRQLDDRIYFAPEVKALLAIDPNGGEIDPAALASFLTAGHLFPHQTLHARIRKLPSCHSLDAKGGQWDVKEYWRFIPGSVPGSGSVDEKADELGKLVQESVSASTDDLGTTMTFLSGGLDSRYILACLHRDRRFRNERCHAVTWGEKNNVRGSDPEVAQKVVASLGRVDHKFMPRLSDLFGEWFREVNYYLDGLSELAVFHPHEFQIMKTIREQGFEKVIRGDEAFGYLGRRYSTESAWATIGIRPFHRVRHLPNLLKPEWYNKLDEANREDLAVLDRRFNGLDPTTLKDVIYFSQRVPTYLSQASYYKQIVLDQRNPLLSHELLDFYQTVPNSLRRHKNLFFRAFNRAFPTLGRIPYATSGGLENWGALMSGDTPLHHFMASEFQDSDSGIWDIIRQDRALELFRSLGTPSGERPPHPLARKARSLAREAVDKVFPARVDQMMMRRSQRRLPLPYLLLRILVLKDWHDRFFSGKAGT
ncbi:hypothetical protein CSB20_11555 [bacterium DOLZORAL124_64_63]|nr:MAG: hypothetical protein CSB20_11555 [bacterium DOLZORAL124_64_63]